MSKSILLSRAVAPATAALGACLLAFVSPASAFTASSKAPGGENTPLDLTTSTGASHSSPGSTGGASIVRTIVGLAIVIAVIWGSRGSCARSRPATIRTSQAPGWRASPR